VPFVCVECLPCEAVTSEIVVRKPGERAAVKNTVQGHILRGHVVVVVATIRAFRTLAL